MRIERLPLLLLLLGAVACGKDEATCTITDNHDGTRTIACPGGVPAVVTAGGTGTSCTLLREPDGWSTIVCDDGTYLRIDPQGNAVFPGTGSITGQARLYGREEHEGITVRVANRPHATTTDRMGRYHLADLPAGLHDVVFEYEGRATETHRSIPVLSGIFELPAVELKHGRRIGPGESLVLPSPAGDSLLVQEGRPTGKLTLWSGAGTKAVPLSSAAFAPSYSVDGRQVLFVEDRSGRGRVLIWHVQEAREELLDARGVRAHFLPDGRSVVVETLENGSDGLVLVDRFRDRRHELGAWLPPSGLNFGPDGGSLAFLRPDRDLILWDVLTGKGALLANRAALAHTWYFQDGAALLHARENARGTYDLHHWDLGLQRDSRLAADIDPSRLQLGPDDGSVLIATEAPAAGWKLWERESEQLHLLGERASDARYLPGGEGVLFWVRQAADAGQASLYRLRSRDWLQLSGRALGLPEVAADGSFAAVVVDEGEGRQTRVIRLSDGASTLLEGEGWAFSQGAPRLYRLNEAGALLAHDCGADVTETLATRVAWWSLGHQGELLFLGATREEGSGERLGIYRVGDRSLRWFTGGAAPVASRNGNSVFYLACGEAGGACNDLRRIDLEAGETELVDQNVVSFSRIDRMLIYVIRVSANIDDPKNGVFLAIVPD